ncbi:MAG: fatty-acid--CoA ligase [Gordonia sp.]|nr:fatty-acid--CoA ligase [Gordonia sp. (in: high G+C Gram-positive bacteria)]
MTSTQNKPVVAVAKATNYWDLLSERVELSPSREFAVDEHGRRFTFAALSDLAETTAAALHSHGVRAGDVVSWQLPSSVESMALSLALSRLGAVQNPIIPMLRESEVAFITGQVGASLLIVPTEFRGFDHGAMATAIAEQADGLRTLIVDDTWMSGDPSTLPTRSERDDNAVSWIFYTSGTTAAPKGVKHGDAGLISAAKTFVTNVQVTPDERCAAYVPITHVGGIAHVLSSLLVGHTLITAAAFVPEDNAKQLISEGATLIGSGLPFTTEYLRISRESGVAPLFPQARATLGGGSGRPAELSRATAQHLGGLGIISGYGMTECPYLTWGSPDDTDDEHAVFEGTPGPQGRVRIVGADGTELPVGEIGEIRVHGPQLFHGYVDSAQDEGALDEQGFFRTGDLGFLNTAGRLSVTGRIKDIIVRKMENISAREIEEALINDPAIADLTVIGMPDDASGERVCAVVVPNDPNVPPDLDSIRAYLATTTLNKRKYPEQVEVVDRIPRNSLGKITKSQVRSDLLDPLAKVSVSTMTSESQYTTVEFEVTDHIATITLNRPDRLNCFNESMANEMAEIWGRVRDDDDIRVAVLQANGDRAFCTGVDVSEGAWWTHINRFNQEDPGVLLGPKQHRVWKPVVCALHGMVAGGAMYFVNESDIVICSDDTTFFDPHANAGIVSALEPMGMLARGIPLGEVLRWALIGSDERMTADSALRTGIVTEITSRPELRDRAQQLAAEIAGRRPEAIQGTVRAIWESLDMTPSTALRTGLSYTQIGNVGSGRSDSRKNKRTPRFR